MIPDLRAPFPYFGGKRIIAGDVWERFGAVQNYIEPFAGSMAVLLGRPHECFPDTGYAETVNDMDGFLCNFWRALAADAEGVAHHADCPVSELDLHARHGWLLNHGAPIVERLREDPDFYDVRIAGWWVWGISQWIGSGWCGRASKQLPKLTTGGEGIHRASYTKLPHLGHNGKGVHRPTVSLHEYLAGLSMRLRHTRVCCGDWKRVVTDGAMVFGNRIGVFLDPPYTMAGRDDVYNHDTCDLYPEILDWCRRYEGDSRIKIALCGYMDDFAMPGWTPYRWTAGSSWLSRSDTRNSENRKNEVVYFSPSCVTSQISLFQTVSFP